MLQLEAQQRLFGWNSAAEPGEVATGANDAMTRDDDWDRIPAIGCADCAHCFWPPDALGYVTIRRRRAIRNLL
jgi:hypothetical protein